MDEEAPTGGDRRGSRRRKRWFIALAVFPLAAFGLSNLALATPWARHWLAEKVHRRTNLETRIDSASWSPWNGITLGGITLQQPAALKEKVAAPLVRISRMEAQPAWELWLQRRWEVRSLKLVSPQIVVPVELVSSFTPPGSDVPMLVQQEAPQPQETPGDPDFPPLAANQPDFITGVPEGNPGAAPQPEIAQAPAAPGTAAPGPAPQPGPTTAAPAATPAPGAPTPAAPPAAPPHPPAAPAFIHLKNASFTLILASTGTTLLEADGLDASIPIAGGPTASELKLRALSILGNKAVHDLKVPLKWEAPVLAAVPTDFELAGLKSKFTAQLGVLKGLPFNFEAVTPNQELKGGEFPGIGTVSAPDFGGSLRMRGLLLSPPTWQAEFISAAVHPVVKVRSNENRFDNARVITILRGGALSCVDARLVSDGISFLGNATVLSNGRAAGVVRIVAEPAATMSVVNQLFPGLTAPPSFSAMSTPQRAALDIEAAGTLGHLQFRLGRGGPIIGAPPAATNPP